MQKKISSAKPAVCGGNIPFKIPDIHSPSSGAQPINIKKIAAKGVADTRNGIRRPHLLRSRSLLKLMPGLTKMLMAEESE